MVKHLLRFVSLLAPCVAVSGLSSSSVLRNPNICGVGPTRPKRWCQLHSQGWTNQVGSFRAIVTRRSASSKPQKEKETIVGSFGSDGFDAIDFESLLGNVDEIKENILGGEFGSRGETYVAVQFALILCVLWGGIPAIGHVLTLVLGPSLLLVGAGVALVSAIEMGGALTPWPVPSEGGGSDKSLITTGPFSIVRHPIYSGLLCLMTGLSVITGSATRLLLTAALLYVLELKTDFEEKKLMEKYPGEYEQYKTDVKGKFFPRELMETLPWVDKE